MPNPVVTMHEQHLVWPLHPLGDEKDVQRACWSLLGMFGCSDVGKPGLYKRYWLSQMRKTGQTKGLPDLLAFTERHGQVWIECKHPTNPSSKQTPEQVAFQHACETAGLPYLVIRHPQQLADWWTTYDRTAPRSSRVSSTTTRCASSASSR